MKEHMEKVSVIVPVYNTQKYLKRCFDSVINQSYKNIELIIVDDGSTDDSPIIIKDYCNKNKNVYSIKQENSRQGAARNKGIKACTGEYILFLDSDDFLPVNAIKNLINIIGDSEIAIGNMIICNEDTKEKIEYNTYFEKEGFERVKYIDDILNEAIELNIKNMRLMDNCGFLSNSCHKLFKREFLLKNKILFPEKMVWEDGPFNLHAWFASKSIAYSTDVVYCRTIRGDEKNKSTIQTVNMSSIRDDIKSHNITFELCKNFDRTDLIPNILLRFYAVNSEKLTRLNNNENKYKKELLRQMDSLKNKWINQIMKENKLMAIKLKYSLGKIKLKHLLQ